MSTPGNTEQKQPEILRPRRVPAQQRSRERYARMLSAARQVLVDAGFESFTFDEVARRADIAIGTLYQFFANKYVMICELDRQDTEAVVAEMVRFSQHVPALEWPDFLSEFIDHLAALWRDDVSRRAVWLAVQSTPATRATAEDTKKQLVNGIAEVLRPLALTSDEEALRFMANLLINATYALLNYSVDRPGSVQERQAHYTLTVQEIKRMMIAYLMSVAHAAGTTQED
ncbi:TetR family transcriptional regulator [Corynebacterium lactis]